MELSTEEKAKRYDEAIKNAKDIYTYECDDAEQLRKIERMFPELKESGDEKMKKSFIRLVKAFYDVNFPTSEGFTREEMLAWLEKQGEQKLYVNDNAKEMFIKALERVEEQNAKGYKLTDCDKNSWWEDFKEYITSEQILANSAKTCKVEPKFKVGDEIKNVNEESLTITKIDEKGYWSEDLFICNFDDADKWKLVEQKPADKYEPKFKVGDFIVNDYCMGMVIELTDDAYLLDTGQGIPFSCEHNARLWTIQDAKPGDVLAFYSEYRGNKMVQVGIIEKYVGKHGGCSNTFKIYVGVNWDNILQIGEYMGCSDIRPATKEQRDQLEKAMANAGYKWDAEKKELKKIEQNNTEEYIETKGLSELEAEAEELTKEISDEIEADKVVIKQGEHNSAWSEEDEKILKEIISDVKFEGYNNDMQANSYRKINWLKSLRPQSTWKPSDEQFKVLNEVLNFSANHESPHWNDYIFGTLNNLIRQLKKLREE